MQIGDVLHNGATVIEFNDKAILAKWINNTTPYVTWRYFNDDPRTTSWGRYFTNLEEAARDYQERKA